MIALFIALALATPAHARALDADPIPANRSATMIGRVKPDRRWKVVKSWDKKLDRMATCESGRRWGLNTGNGFFGGLQFTFGTWRAAGGSGYPHYASELEQKYRAVLWYRKIGTWVTFAGWPRCGYR